MEGVIEEGSPPPQPTPSLPEVCLSLPCPKIDPLTCTHHRPGLCEGLLRPIQGLVIDKQMLPSVTKEGNMSSSTNDAIEKISDIIPPAFGQKPKSCVEMLTYMDEFHLAASVSGSWFMLTHFPLSGFTGTLGQSTAIVNVITNICDFSAKTTANDYDVKKKHKIGQHCKNIPTESTISCVHGRGK